MTNRVGLIRAASVVALVTIISKILGFMREASLAAVFGATWMTDAYLVGQTIPVIVFAAVGAALGTTFIPVYAQVTQTRGREAAFAMTSSLFNATAILSIVVIAAGELMAGPLARAVAPGFQGQVHDLTVAMSRIMFPMVLFQALSGLVTGMLQTEGQFAVPALVGLGFNAVLITATLAFGPRFGIRSVGVATVIAAAVQAVLQLPALLATGYRWRPILDLRDPGLIRIVKLTGPVLLGTSAVQIGLIVDRMLASNLAAGSVAALNYANRLMTLVPSILGAAITTVMYPTLSRFAAQGNWHRFTTAFAETVRVINFMLIPVAVGLGVLRVPVVQLVFQRGAFDAQATEATAWALLFFCIGIAVFTLRDMISRAFFAFQDTTAPMVIGVAAVGINVVLNLLLVGPLRQGGLALATSLAGAFGAFVLLTVLRSRVRKASGGTAVGIGGLSILNSLWRVLTASAVMGVVVWAVHSVLVSHFAGQSIVYQSLRLSASVGIGIVTYIALVLALRVPEASMALKIIRAGLTKGDKVEAGCVEEAAGP